MQLRPGTSGAHRGASRPDGRGAQPGGGQRGMACSRSATMSSGSSRPTEIRSRPSVMPIAAWSSGGRLTWVLVAEWHTSVSGPPSDVAERATRRPSSVDAGGVDAAGQVDRQHGRASSTAARPPARAAGGRRQPGWCTARRRRGGARSASARTRADAAGLTLAHGERADAAQPVQRVERRRARAVQHGVGPDRRRSGRARRRPPRAWRRCDRRCPWWPSARRGRRRCGAAAGPIGVANVESIIVNGPRTAPRSSRSTRSRRGFDGDSATTSIVVPGCTASANAPGVVPSTQVTSMPKRAHGPSSERRSCRCRSGAGRRCGRRTSTARARPRRWRPCPTRRPARPRRPRGRRPPPRTPARWGWRSGCRTRRRAVPTARLRVSSSPLVCHVLVPHSGGARLEPCCARPR